VTRIAALIPVGSFVGAKTRLGESLDAEERLDLVDGLLAHTVAAALGVDRLADVLVVSPDRDVRSRAAGLGARTLRQRSRGLNRGLREGIADVVAGGADAALILPIDLPFVSPAEIIRVLEPLGEGEPVVVLVTDRHGTGTNLLGLRPPGAIDVAFGPGSRLAHRRAAEAASIAYVEVDGPLSVDLDTPDDLVYVESLMEAGVHAG
jgi:2-phospho-L-lactate guanylyltransferase